MKESDAREKMCPLFTIASVVVNEGAKHCHGSDCMLWSYYEDEIVGWEDSGAPVIRKADGNSGDCWLKR